MGLTFGAYPTTLLAVLFMSSGLSSRQILQILWELGYTLTLPLFGCVIVGRLLDRVLDLYPLFLFIGIGISFILTSILLSRKAVSLFQRLEKPAVPYATTEETV